MKDTDIHSYHIFMFPFSLRHKWKENDIHKLLSAKGWVRQPFDYCRGDFASNFSEMSYFYEFSTGAMYDDSDSISRVVLTYSMPLGEDARYKISVNKNGAKYVYNLHLEKVEFNVYDDKAAILSFHLANTDYSDMQDILRINDYGRRCYPQYLANDSSGELDMQKTKNSFLADCIEVDLGNGHCYWDDFSYFDHPQSRPFVMPKFIRGLLPDKMHDCRWLLDDRMYVVSLLCDEEKANMFGKLSYEKESIVRQMKEYEDWYQYVFIDNGGPTCVEPNMFARLLSEATYTRWNPYGTLFGISRYSFAILSTHFGCFTLNLLRQTKTLYYRMASLALVQRVLALYFSREITWISKDIDEKKILTRKLRQRVDELNRDYLRFVNNIYFREVTPQDQGIELYDLMQKQMNIPRDENGLSGEIEQLHNYIEMKNEDRRNADMERLTWIATLFLPSTLIVGIFGMNSFDSLIMPQLFWQVVIAVVVTLAFILILKLKNKNNN